MNFLSEPEKMTLKTRNKQLYSHTSESFRIFSALNGDGSRESRSASYVPIMRWPHGFTCVEVNIFTNRLLDAGYSIKSRGGTLATYCSYLTPLVRYCFNNQKLPSELTDSDFRFAFVQLSAVDKSTGEPRNNRKTTTKIGAVWLEFLQFVGEYYSISNYVSKSGAIKGYKKRYERKIGKGKIRYEERWFHDVFPPEVDPTEGRMPLNEADVTKLRAAADDGTTAYFIKQRRLVSIELFDILGFRRLEAVLLRVCDVEAAIKAEIKADKSGDTEFTPSITFRSVKKRGNIMYERTVPINRISLEYLKSYNRLRKRHLDALGVKETPDSAFLVSYKSGKRLRANTLTQEFRILAKQAKIVGPCSPHMMRHRFITQAFVRLVRSHQINSVDEFHRMLLDSYRFKQEVREYAGHVSDETLDVYIHLALDQVASFKKVLNRAELEGALDALSRSKERLRTAQSRGDTIGNHVEEFLRAVEHIEKLRARI
ncbi:Phage integrase family protein [Paraburkholderia phenazinium]|uniref:Phage integrase family protein n=1 Tax=Paraburkholderia phenazinium TaxID=60549 RepID=A0A1G7WS12_9BURK|nr:tyrosine-type recombinase/integrase [Paraburkholderia phenazinium]SDG74713.1 Phage integrase family protein [Paraburkholderia phenazinium]